MANFWIVSSYPFCEHPSMEVAVAEQARLSAAEPKKKFRVFRCKTNIYPTDSFELIGQARALLTRAAEHFGDVDAPLSEDIRAYLDATNHRVAA